MATVKLSFINNYMFFLSCKIKESKIINYLFLNLFPAKKTFSKSQTECSSCQFHILRDNFHSISIGSGRVPILTGAGAGILMDSVIILNQYLIHKEKQRGCPLLGANRYTHIYISYICVYILFICLRL